LKSKKNLNIILIALLLCIWSAIGYKYFFKKTPEKITSDSIAKIEPIAYNVQKDTFQIQTIQNPFSGRKIRAVASNTNKASASRTGRKKNTKKIIKPIAWPKVKYHGYVFTKGKAKKLVALNVNGKFLKKRAGDIILEQIEILEVYEDSIKLRMNKEHKMIKKSK